jgi:membrane-bound ClpP family serine protease
MINWITILLLLILGVALLIIEIIFIPGTTLVGILGLLFMLGGIITSYSLFGPEVGHWVLAITVISGGLVTWLALKSGFWKKLALKNTISARVNEELIDTIKVGDVGKTTSMLRPSGNALFEKGIFEVHSPLEMLKSNVEIKVIKIENNKIIVTPLN